MKKIYLFITISVLLFFLVGCTRASTSKKNHKELSERIVELDLKQKTYYQVSIEISNNTGVDRYNYMYIFNDITNTYYSNYRVNNTEYIYKFHDDNVLIKINNDNSLEEQELQMTFEEYANNYISLFGSVYGFDLKKASYKREEILFSFSSTSYLKNIFIFNLEYEYNINLFDLEFTITEITVEFGSTKNKNDSTLFDDFNIIGKNSEGYNVKINISQ